MKTAMTPQFSFLVMVTVLVLNHHSIITLSSQGLDGRQTPLPKPGGNNFWQLSHYSATSQTPPSVLGMSYLFMGWSGNLGGKLLLRNYGGAVLFRWLKGENVKRRKIHRKVAGTQQQQVRIVPWSYETGQFLHHQCILFVSRGFAIDK